MLYKISDLIVEYNSNYDMLKKRSDKYLINDKYKVDMNQIKNTLQSIKEKFSNMEI